MAVWSCFGVLNMYQFKRQKTELNLLFESFEENKRLYFLTHFSGVLLYVLVSFLNFYWNPFFRAVFDVWGETVFEKWIWSNFYLTVWYVPCYLVYVRLMAWIVNNIRLKRINMFLRNSIGFIGCSIQNSMTPLMLGNLIFLHKIGEIYG